VNGGFLAFPPTPHLATLPGVTVRGDKVLTECERAAFLQHELTVEEKVDGANLGISFDAGGDIRAWNRGEYVRSPGAGQWKRLDAWLELRMDALFEHLSERYILFGEWCYACHSVFYDSLPDWFLAFDVYDQESGRFLSVIRRNRLLEKMSLARVPSLARGRFSFAALKNLLSRSAFSENAAEGIYLRLDQGDWLGGRAKLVRPAFIQTIEEHWSRSVLRTNRLSEAFRV
jgi:ATP-dependent RNA circularization protein (DNA/RNA ligase family)